MNIREINDALVARAREALPGWEIHTMTPDLDRAIEQFVAAVGPRRTHSDGTYTEGFTKYIVEALLAAGWTPPEVAR